jgi:hypothetical protein
MMNLQNSRTPTLAVLLTLMLAACAERVPLSETRPVPPVLQPAVAAIRPAWAGQMESGSFACEQGHRVDIRVDGDAMDLVWKGSTYKMTPVSTSTGAVRYENPGDGLVWIQIPSKSMLLSSKLGKQLANNCRNR